MPPPLPARTEGALITDAYARTADTTLAALGSSPAGLTEAEAEQRLVRYGPNALQASRPTSAWKILFDQVASIVVLLLAAAAIVALALGDPLDAGAIFVVLLLNTALGFATEIRARRAMEALLRFETPRALVIRAGEAREIDAPRLVPGDIVQVEAGQSVPADARLLDAVELRTDEASLTGESVPADKNPAPLPANTPLAERDNMLYQGTTVVAGSGRAVVVATGMSTEVGRIGGLVAGIQEEKTPLERRLDQLGGHLVWLALATAALVAGVSVAHGQPPGEVIETALALAIAAVPEGLPAVATITLAVGVRRMARRRALVRRLPAVESLGSATVVCTDKTGTLTAGEMTVTTLWLGGREVAVSGQGYAPTGEFREGERSIEPGKDPLLLGALRTATQSSHGDVVEGPDGSWLPLGDPTESAILAAARKAGLDPDALLAEEPRVGELPFSSERMYAASFHRTADGRLVAHVKGAPGRVLPLCATVLTPIGPAPLDEPGRARLLDVNAEFARRGLRVLALASGAVEARTEAALQALTFLGFVGMIDPPAPGVRATIRRLRAAGIRTIMLTGDQRLTAEAVARELGVLAPGEETLDGRTLASLTPEQLAEHVRKVAVISRVGPEDKLDIVEALQHQGEIVAMLGDGVNDAAALKRADIGVAMGRRGTDVAREAAAVILQDDRFPTIAAAVEEGRVIFGNIRKFVFYLFSCNIAEVLVLLIAGIIGVPAPLLPLQILWLNLVTDTFPALSLAFEPAERDTMREPPRAPGAALLSGSFTAAILFYGAMLTGVSLVALFWARSVGNLYSVTFMTLALSQTFHLANARARENVLDPARIFANPYAVGAVALTVALQLLALYLPPLAHVLRLDPFTLHDWFVVIPLSLLPAMAGQLLKMTRIRFLSEP